MVLTLLAFEMISFCSLSSKDKKALNELLEKNPELLEVPPKDEDIKLDYRFEGLSERFKSEKTKAKEAKKAEKARKKAEKESKKA